MLAALFVSLPALTNRSIHQDPAAAAIRSELSEPFCYFKHPTDQLGLEGCPNATVVTYDGAFLSAYGQLSFYAGPPGNVRPISKRVKTLQNGYLPIILFAFDRDGLHYEFESFATPVHLDRRNNLITFIQCKISNPGRDTKRAILGANFGPIESKINIDPNWPGFAAQRQGLQGALQTQRDTKWHSRQFMDSAKFQADPTQVAFDHGRMIQSGHLVCLAPSNGTVQGMPDFASPYKTEAIQYDVSLSPGASRTFRFKMPAVPVDLTRIGKVADVANADYDVYREGTLNFWRRAVAPADHFFVDEPKVVDTFRTSLVNDLVAREVNWDGNVYQRVNRIQYNYMWIRDSSFFTRTYDMLGLHAIAAQTLKDFIVWKDGEPVEFFKPGAPQPDGARMSVQDDYWGQVLWAMGQHYRATRDRAFLTQIYPLLGPHIQDFVQKCRSDPRGLWPVAGPYDNEAINGHYTGHSFWAILGLKYAVLMAHAMRRQADEAAWSKILDDYKANFLTQLRALTAQSDGYIPPGMDNVRDGNDWDNASGGIYPFEVLSPQDPLARETLDMVRDYNYREGIITYGGNAWVARQLKKQGKASAGGTLHHYETFYVTESNNVLGRQPQVIQDLYSILAHTGSTNSGFEFGIPAWGSRDPGDNFTPHGWFAAKYMSLIRDMLVREQGDTLHLASALSPVWIAPGKRVQLKDAPTFFGDVSYLLQCRKHGATLHLSGKWNAGGAPKTIVFHIPWFVKVRSATLDGRPAKPSHGAVALRPNSKILVLNWTWTAHPDLSFRQAVRLYLDKYYRPADRGDGAFLFPNGAQ